MGHREELQRLQHQLELASCAIVLISDKATAERLDSFADRSRAGSISSKPPRYASKPASPLSRPRLIGRFT